MASLTLRHIRKAFGENLVVRQLDLEIAQGELVVLLGPSGCGKTTVLRMISGLETITEGEVLIGDRVVNDLNPGERGLAFVFQNYALYPHMTVWNNIAFCLGNQKVPKPEIHQRVDEVARIVHLEQLLGRMPSQLSGGQRQRVAIARAIVRRPPVLLMDEPLSNLDARLRSEMRAELARIQGELGITTFYVTHDQVEAMTLADRVAVMHEGVVQQVGSPMEIYRHPRNTFVACFVGSPAMNFVDVSVLDENGLRKLRADGVAITLPGQIARRLETYAGGRLILGFRPQSVSPASPHEAQFTGLVELTEPHGHEAFISLRLGDAIVSGRLDPGTEPVKGEPFGLKADPADFYFFDPSTRQSIH